jgi:hypothetical protein|tara:strand:- start:2540 stop:2947 length:408 start_codon:yes stop_codon:yes gene_type:complete
MHRKNLQEVIMESITVKVNVSDNPWIASYKEFSFSREKIEPIAKKLVVECTGRDYKASHSYGKHVSFVMEKSWDNTCGSIIPLYKSLLVVLKELKKPDEGWSGGATAAIRCIESRMAYATPGFIEAKRYSEIYGS